MPTQTFTTGDDTFTIPAGPGTYDLDFLAGNDTLTINGGDSTVAHMDEGNDTVTINLLNSGTATIYGGLGDDTYNVKTTGVTLIENASEGTDLVNSSISWVLGTNFENLTLTGTAAINGTGNTLGNIIRGNAAGNVLDGGSGSDQLYGGAGDDTLIGGAGNDLLQGSTGADSMTGGIGNDTYYVDNVGDGVTENTAEGTDLVNAAISYTLGANVENLTLSGASAIDGTGNTLNNIIHGNTGVNILDGAGGNDQLFGGGGDDTLIGGAGNDKLNGGTGADTMSGGVGDDVYYVDSTAGDLIIENLGEGTDVVYSSVSYTLPDNVEKLILTGPGDIDGSGNALSNTIRGTTGSNVISGGDGNDSLYGAAGNDTLNGGNGIDYLDGGLGADTMSGGAGNDTYYVDNIGDVIVENPGEGTEVVYASVSYTLASNVEKMILSGSAAIDGTGNSLVNVIRGNEAANVISGLDGNDTLYGNGGNDTLDGGNGVDTMYGGLGNDTYVVDNTGDVVSENPGEGTDLVQSSITYTLGSDVENLTLTGSSAINGTGNGLDNIITGNSAANVLMGGDGNDTIHGGGGADMLTGGVGNDTFTFTDISDSLPGSADTITDFTTNDGEGSDDQIDLSGIDADTSVAGDQAFTIDTSTPSGPFTPAAHSIWLSATANPDGSDDWILYGDVNGDTTADFELHFHTATQTLQLDDITM
jgi:trimeric autotransporter adhesin